MPEGQKADMQKVDDAKRWLLIRFREMLRGAKLTDQITRFVSGELGSSYRFQTEIALDDRAVEFIRNPKNADRLKAENLE